MKCQRLGPKKLTPKSYLPPLLAHEIQGQAEATPNENSIEGYGNLNIIQLALSCRWGLRPDGVRSMRMVEQTDTRIYDVEIML